MTENTAQLRNDLGTFLRQDASANVVAGEMTELSLPPVAFFFTGQGSQYIGMGRDLYESSPTFRRVMDRCDEILRPHLERPLLSVLYPEANAVSVLDDTAYTQPALFAIEYSLAELWRSWGVQPAFVLGHSVGEFVAACVAGVFGLEDGLRLIAERGCLMHLLPAGGRMAAIFAGQTRVESAIASFDGVSVAAINGPEIVVISGEGIQVETILKRFSDEGIKSKDLLVSHAFHSPLMNPVLDAFEEAASKVRYSDPTVGFVSTLTGELADGRLTGRGDYWRRQAREPVQFAKAVRTIEEQGVKVFLELGPNPVLMGMARRCLKEEGQLWLPSLRSRRGEWRQMFESLQALYIAGADIDWKGVDRDYSRTSVAWPTYPFQRRRYWLDREDRRHDALFPDPEDSWQAASKAALHQSRQTPMGINVGTYLDKWRCLERLTTAQAVNTLRTLGAFAHADEVEDAESLVQRFGIPSFYKLLLQRWLERLAATGHVARRSRQVCQCRTVDGSDLASRIARDRTNTGR